MYFWSVKNLLEIKNLSIGYDEPLISGIDMSIDSGKLVVLIGRNGSGKTTFFKTLIGRIKPLKGTIQVGGKELSQIDSKEISKLISVVLTERPSVSGLTVRTVVSMGRHPYTGSFGKLSESDNIKIDQAVEEMGISHLSDKQINEISDGEFQKMMLARALCQDTPVIFMDEPASFLDYPSKLELLKSLKKMAETNGKLIIFSSHEIPILKGFASEVIGFKEGTFVYSDLGKESDSKIFNEILEYE